MSQQPKFTVVEAVMAIVILFGFSAIVSTIIVVVVAYYSDVISSGLIGAAVFLGMFSYILKKIWSRL